jgi:hypothetical protein
VGQPLRSSKHQHNATQGLWRMIYLPPIMQRELKVKQPTLLDQFLYVVFAAAGLLIYGTMVFFAILMR